MRFFFSIVVSVVSVAACTTTTPPATTAPSPLPTVSSGSTARAEPPQALFTSVVIGTNAEHVRIFPVGDRALVARAATLVGSTQRGARYIADAHVGDGLSTSATSLGASHVQAVGGAWPDVVVVTGQKELAEYAGPNSVMFLERQNTFSASKASFIDVPRMAALSKGVAYLFVPDSSHFIAGLDTSRCAKPTLEDLPVLAIRGDQKLATPRAVSSFFAQALGDGFIVGADMCRPGAFIASLDDSPLHLELVPGSAACTERTNVEGMPFTHAYVFPSASGGRYVLLVNQPASSSQPDDAARRTGACTAPPQVIERSATGTWSAPRPLPEGVRTIDPAGTAWAITDHTTIKRISQSGATREIALDATCARDATEIVAIVVPFPDQPWITVTYQGERTGLCVAYL